MADQVSSTSDVVLYFLAIFIPPLAVFFSERMGWFETEGRLLTSFDCKERGLKADFWINILLWILGWIPGVIHAWYIISKSEGAM